MVLAVMTLATLAAVMSSWEDGMADMDAALMAEFSIPVTLHLDTGDKPVQGIFDNPAAISDVDGGGYIASSEPTLHLHDHDVKGMAKRSLVTVKGKKWMVTRPLEPDGTGMTKLTLGHHDGKSASKSSIRY
ncbi:head-tail joining protein [Enterovibrio norvegicus]|uniref:head-tail joining protein n=1 Tax=Enterovibrio norvegicus TaxID=188144 RepID=UPI003552D7C3